jgi:ligand-binding sensor domain-containing protein
MSKIKFSHIFFISVVISLIYGCNNDDPIVEEEFVFPSKVINRIIVDTNGSKWFATEKGVVSYDGIKWTSYTDDQNITTGSISDIAFNKLAGIKKLWLGTNVGLSSYEFGTSTISTDNFNTSKDEILSDTVSAVGVDDVAVKYIGTSNGLSILKRDKWDKFYGRLNEEILSEYKISAIAVSQNGYIYATTEGGGISRFKYADAISGATIFNLPWAG